MFEKKITNRPYYYYSLLPNRLVFVQNTYSSFMLSTTYNITLLLGLGSTRYNFVSENIAIQPLSVPNILKYVNIETRLAGKKG